MRAFTIIIPHKDQVNEVSGLYWECVRHRGRDSNVVSSTIHSGSLTFLQITVSVPTPDIEAIILHGSSLDSLHLPHGHPFAVSTLAKMSCGKLLPKLDKISCMLTSETQDAYFDMLESRRVFPCASISMVNFYALPEGLRRNVVREENFKNVQGLNITVHNSPACLRVPKDLEMSTSLDGPEIISQPPNCRPFIVPI